MAMRYQERDVLVRLPILTYDDNHCLLDCPHLIRHMTSDMGVVECRLFGHLTEPNRPVRHEGCRKCEVPEKPAAVEESSAPLSRDELQKAIRNVSSLIAQHNPNRTVTFSDLKAYFNALALSLDPKEGCPPCLYGDCENPFHQ